MKKILTQIILTIFILFSVSFAQKIPNSIYLKSDKLGKIVADQNPVGNAVEYIEFMGNDVWIATSVGLSKSSDNGETWTSYKFDEEGISALGFKNDTVWVATWHAEDFDGEVVPVGSGLHYSPDKGDTWIDVPQPVDASDDSSIVYGINTLRSLPLTVEEGNFTRDIGFLGNEIWIASFYGGLRKSKDNGKTWEKVVLPPDHLDFISPDQTLNFDVSPSTGALGFKENLNHRFFSIHVVDDSTILIGTANGINLSTDKGISWRKFNHQNQENSMSGNFILDINYDHSRNTIWAATWKAEGETEYYGLSSSSDFGENWKTYLSGENIHNIAFTYSLSGNERDIFVASDNGVFRTNDLGTTWFLAPDMRDDITNLPITTTKFRAVNGKLDQDNFNNLWFGSEAGSALLVETGAMWKGDWKVFVSSPKITSGSKSLAFPNPFTPDDELVKIKYSFSGSSKSITIRIFDFGMNLVRTVIQNVTKVGGNEYIDSWDGRDENSEYVPNGVYFYRIDIGNDEPLYGKIMVLM
ncbi:MAG: hypothetical protein H6612_08120 [Ignavibacteriales bacterium]|nr:hypothetical protein [Ignavibacteriales bacterium]MCB9259306.1 hypothetical protein [Ignavibacteriales bacterium]